MTAPYDLANWVTDLVFAFLHGLFNRYGAPIVFVAAIIEATIGLGLVFPGVAIMFLGGAAAAQGELSVTTVIIAAITGTMIGDAVSYAAGRWGSAWVLRTRIGPSLRLGGELMRGRARWFIPFYHFHNITRSVGPFGAGLIRLPLPIWAPLDMLGIVLANVLYVVAGFVLGAALLRPDGTLDEHPAVRLGLAALGVVWFLLVGRAYIARVKEYRRGEALRREAALADARARPVAPVARRRE